MIYYFKIKLNHFWFLISVIVLLVTSHCGFYSFSGSSLPPHLKTIAIPVFDDRTSEFGVREKISEALIEEFIKDNTLKISDPRGADSILEGTITRIRDQAGAYNADEQVQDIKVFVTVDIKFSDVSKQQVIWEEQLTQWGTYDPDVPDSRDEGIDEAIDKLVADIFNKTIAGW